MLPAFVPAMPPANTSAPALVDAAFVVTVTSTPSIWTFLTLAPLPSWAKSPPWATAPVPLRFMCRLKIMYCVQLAPALSQSAPWNSPV